MTIAVTLAAAATVDPALLGASANSADQAARDAESKKQVTASRAGEFAGSAPTSFEAGEKAAATLVAAEEVRVEAEKVDGECARYKGALTGLTDCDQALKGIQAKRDESAVARAAAAATDGQASNKEQQAKSEEALAADCDAAANASDTNAGVRRGEASRLEGEATGKESEAQTKRDDAARKKDEAGRKEAAGKQARQQATEKDAQACSCDAAVASNGAAADEQKRQSVALRTAAEEQIRAASDYSAQAGKYNTEAETLGTSAAEKAAQAQARQQEAARLRGEAATLRRSAQEKFDQALDIEGLGTLDYVAESRDLGDQANALESNAAAAEADASRLSGEASTLRGQGDAARRSAEALAAQRDEANRKAEQAQDEAARLTTAADEAQRLQEHAKEQALRLRAEHDVLFRQANEEDQAAKQLRAAAGEDAKAADASAADAGQLRGQSEQAALAASDQDHEAQRLRDQAAAHRAAAAAATREATELRNNKAAELARSTRLDQEVRDAEATPAYKALDTAKNTLPAQPAVIQDKTLAFNAAEVKAELVKAQAERLAAKTEASKFLAGITPCVSPAPEKKVAADERLRVATDQVQQLEGLDQVMTHFLKLQHACRAAAQSLAEANVEKDAMVTARLAQLRLQGHGPQRHCDPDQDTLKKRAVYGIDPETGSQAEALPAPPPPPAASQKLHVCGACASRFKTPDDYVKAEAAMRALLKDRVCPASVPVLPLPVNAGKIEPLLDTVFNPPDAHCEGFAPAPALGVTLPKVMTTLGAATPVPRLAGAAPPAPIYPRPPTFPPLIYPVPPPATRPTLSNGLIDRYKIMANAAVIHGINPQTAVETLANMGGAKKELTDIIAAFPAVVAAPPLPVTEHDLLAMRTFINTPGTTTAPSFAGGKFTAIFKAVVTTNPCGEWTLITMYPNP